MRSIFVFAFNLIVGFLMLLLWSESALKQDSKGQKRGIDMGLKIAMKTVDEETNQYIKFINAQEESEGLETFDAACRIIGAGGLCNRIIGTLKNMEWEEA